MLLKSEFCLCLASLHRFVLTSPQLLDKTLWTFFSPPSSFDSRRIKGVKLDDFPQWHYGEAHCHVPCSVLWIKTFGTKWMSDTYSKSSRTLAWARAQPRACSRARVRVPSSNICFCCFFVYMFFFLMSSCAAKLQLSHMMQLVRKRITMRFLEGNVNKKRFQRDSWQHNVLVQILEINWNGKLSENSSRGGDFSLLLLYVCIQ